MGPLLLAAVLAAPVAAASPRFSIKEVAPGIFAAVANPADESSLGNAGFVVGPDAVLVVDTFATPGAAEELFAVIRRRTPLPVRWVVDTHRHGDHIGGNAVFGAAGATILAHENVRARAVTEPRDGTSPAETPARAGARLPDVTYRDAATVWLGNRRIDLLARAGHTGSDSIVAVPDARVVFAGDLFSREAIPNLAEARVDAWIETLDGLLRGYPDATFVPGHGQPGKALDVRFFRDYLRGLRLAVARAMREGKSGAALVAAVKPQLAERYARWTWFEHVESNITDMEAELKGTKAYPPAPSP
jgi:cyclase